MEKYDNFKEIIIRNRKLSCMELIGSLDDYRSWIGVQSGRNMHMMYCQMICPLQDMLMEYCSGAKIIQIDERSFERYHLPVPKSKQYPEAIIESFFSMECIMHMDLSDLLDDCAENSVRYFQRLQEEKEQEKKHILDTALCVQELEGSVTISSHSITSPNTPDSAQEKITFLLNLYHKKQEKNFEISAHEAAAIQAWCMLLVEQSLNLDGTLSYGTMKRLMNGEFLSESDVETLLNAYGIHKDFEWYDEDFIGDGPESKTDLKITDVISKCENELKDAIGLVKII